MKGHRMDDPQESDRGEMAPLAQQERIGTPRMGWVVGVQPGGSALVDFPGNRRGPLSARTTLTLEAGVLERAMAQRQPVVLLFENGDPVLPLLVGLLQEPSPTPLTDAILERSLEDVPKEARVDGKRVVIEGRNEVVLRCGKASLTLRRDGTVEVRGMNIKTEAEGVQRIRGGRSRSIEGASTPSHHDRGRAMTRARMKPKHKKGLRKLKGKKRQDAANQGDEAGGDEESKRPPSKHTWEGTYLLKKHKPGCVNRHVSWYAASNTCSHRGQAKKRAKADFTMYLKGGANSSVPEGQDEWDPRSSGNYESSASIPFSHEAHHVVAAAELSNAIIQVSKGIEPENRVLLMMRGGLLKEKYNVNDEINMIILPMDLEATKRLGLPLHRKTPEHRFHNAYSSHIENMLEKKFTWLKEAAEKHEVPPYQSTRERIESLSKETYQKIKDIRPLILRGDMDEYDLDSVTSQIFGKPSSGKARMKSTSGRPGSRK